MHLMLSRRSLFSILCAFVLLLSGVIPALAQTPAASPEASPMVSPVAATSLLNLADMDPSVDPGEDFYRFVNGGWVDRTEVPPDWPSYGSFEELIDRTERQTLELLKGIQVDPSNTSLTDTEKAALLFQQGTDLETRNAQGLAPIQPVLDRYDAVTTLEELHALWVDPTMVGYLDLFNLDVIPDPADSTMNVIWLSGPFLGLPAVEYYTEDTPDHQAARDAYLELVANLLEVTGMDEAMATATAAGIYAFEDSLAEHMVTTEEAQDFSVIYNPMQADEMAAGYPMLDWTAYLAALGVEGSPTILNTELELNARLDEIVKATDLGVLKNYLKVKALHYSSDLLGEDLQALVFPYAQALLGMESQTTTEKEVLSMVNGIMGDAVGQLYVAEYFPPESKERITELVENVVAAFRARLQAAPWMTDETRATAIEKLDAMQLKLGYPDVWQTYESVEIGPSYFDTVASASLADYRSRMATAGKPVDKSEWWMLAQEVNAGYDPFNNDMTFPAAILQPPFFDPNADDAWNYGSTGMTIGHEITHGFDLQGSQFDTRGNFVDWWSEEDRTAFMELNDQVVEMYSAIEVLPGLFVDGQLTVGENVADMGGLQAAWDAFLMTLAEGGSTEMIDGFTPQQRFFIAYTSTNRSVAREELLITLVQSNVHAPWEVRAVVPVQQMDAFYEAFDIGPGEAMYLPPEKRIVIW
jgi:putative endopeptidase